MPQRAVGRHVGAMAHLPSIGLLRGWLGAALGLVLVIAFYGGAWAQPSERDEYPGIMTERGPLSPPGRDLQPGEYCLDVHNTADWTVFGHVMNADRLRSNFRLQPDEAVRICQVGELYEGDRVYIQLRNPIIPIFDCKTRFDQPIIIHGQRDEDATRTWFDCR